MKTASKALLFAISAIAGATPAFASDDAPFTGPRVDVEAGWGRVEGKDRKGSDGFTYGATAGYDIAYKSLRIAPEIGISDSTQKDCDAYPAGGNAARECQRSDRDLYAGVRLGYVATPQLLLFGKAGYTNARFADRFSGITQGTATGHAENRDGYRFGAGAEYAITPSVFVTGEYRYSHWDARIHQNQVLAGVGVRF